MKQNKLVIFDWGGVIEKNSEGIYDSKEVVKRILKRLGVKNISEEYFSEWIKCEELSKDKNIFCCNENIYKKVLEDTKLKPRDILFIDDKVENLKTAHSLGFRIYLATGEDFENIKNAVNSFLNLI